MKQSSYLGWKDTSFGPSFNFWYQKSSLFKQNINAEMFLEFRRFPEKFRKV